ncbi:lysophospholipid acyltransferase family protein [Mesoplasma lactucae]|uniref:1-acyl-sn-glycerol-3-phosphate acyltransferase n=1 Tax=Mesoplasma lactucae ATCC 49193 TaxID=81460 RepID=A0A291IRU6_9MOLU|nr:lysophospholipid acyltransferase family protein [Mesoplasma lactucae]ATG97474.1 1-acyl-sn-glycerol-3-phosphate acyltransferase [Mesoplasma lactucae ATCC 49193]ATZ20071.1 1-acyl-sn-glycerol-3-phosphate acyltransferase [Mesoplasma lactucae ATCC 49193]MCL8216819.1 hypothetical protein [Mesoplasma lactucae ATCC 49193]
MSKKQKEQPKEKFFVDKGKMVYDWPSALHTYKKAKKINKKNKKDPLAYSEQYRYDWLSKRVQKAMPLFDVDIQVQGIENWLDKGVVLMPNHESNFDVIALLAINDFQRQQPLAFIAKKELWNDKKASRFLNLIDSVPLDRNSPRSALQAFKESKDLIVDFKRSMVLFPTGTRSYSNEIGEIQPASMKLAKMANAPIIPVTFIDSYKVFAPNRKHGRVTVKVIFGKPIQGNKLLASSTTDLANLVQKEIEKNRDEYMDKELTPLKELRMTPKQKAKFEKKQAKKTNKKSKGFKDLFKVID